MNLFLAIKNNFYILIIFFFILLVSLLEYFFIEFEKTNREPYTEYIYKNKNDIFPKEIIIKQNLLNYKFLNIDLFNQSSKKFLNIQFEDINKKKTKGIKIPIRKNFFTRNIYTIYLSDVVLENNINPVNSKIIINQEEGVKIKKIFFSKIKHKKFNNLNLQPINFKESVDFLIVNNYLIDTFNSNLISTSIKTPIDNTPTVPGISIVNKNRILIKLKQRSNKGIICSAESNYLDKIKLEFLDSSKFYETIYKKEALIKNFPDFVYYLNKSKKKFDTILIYGLNNGFKKFDLKFCNYID